MLMSYETLKSWIGDIFEMTSDYTGVVLTEDDRTDIACELIDYTSLTDADVEKEINKKLNSKGYCYNTETCIWELGKKFTVSITETLNREITVIAQSNSEAMKKVHEQYDNEEIVLDSGDFVDAHFDAWLCENEEC